MGRPERPVDPHAGPVEQIAHQLRELRDRAGRPTYRWLARQTHYSTSTLADAAKGDRLATLAVTLAYATACGGDADEWSSRWRRTAEELERLRLAERRSRCPYPGLATLDAADADLFFGRSEAVASLLDASSRARLIAVFGASGCGKSSLLRAGLVPRLDAAGVATAIITPGSQPLDAFIAARDQLGTAERAVLVIDQFEELFTQCLDESQREAFLDALVKLVSQPDSGIHVIIGVRADFYGYCAQDAGLALALRGNVQYPLAPMNETELREIIARPAEAVGLAVEPALVATVLADSAGQPGALPLVAHALREAWNRHSDGGLRLADYRATGGLGQAIAQTSEGLYETLDAEARKTVRRVLLRLTALGDGTDVTRRRIERAELSGLADDSVIDQVIGQLADARLIVIDEGAVDVSHEALIHAWPRLATWLADDRERLRIHRRLTEAAAEWDRADRDEAYLFRGPRLAQLDRDDDALNDLERTFLARSHQRESEARSRARRRARRRTTSVGITAIVVSVLAVVALVQADRIAGERDLAFSRQLLADARGQLQRDPELALLLAREAYKTQPTQLAETVLRQAVAEARLRHTEHTGQGQVLGVAYSVDGRRIATSGEDGTLRVWTADRHGRPHGTPTVLNGCRCPYRSPAFSRDGSLVAAAGPEGTASVWDLRGGTQRTMTLNSTSQTQNVAFSPDGTELATASLDGSVRVWDHQRNRQRPVLHIKGQARGLTYSPRGDIAVGASDGTVRIWNTRHRRADTVLREHTGPITDLTYSRDGRWLGSASSDGTARVHRVGGPQAPQVLGGHAGSVQGVAISPDGQRVATTGVDATVLLWSVGSATNPLALRGHDGTVLDVVFSPDGKRVATVSADGTLRIWDAEHVGQATVRQGPADGGLWAVTPTPDDKHLLGGGADRNLYVWPATGQDRKTTLPGHNADVVAVAVAPSGNRVATASEDGTARLWDLRGAPRPRVLRGHAGGLRDVAFSPDGDLLATAGLDGTVRLWNTNNPTKPIAVVPEDGPVRAVTFSPDGRRLATAGFYGSVQLRDVATRRLLRTLSGHTGPIWALAYSPDGHRLASAGDDGTVRLWDTQTGRGPIVLSGHRGVVWDIAFSPDGRWLVSSGADGTARIWKTNGHTEPITIDGFGASIERARFSRNGTNVITAHGDGTARVWQCRPCQPVPELLATAHRLTTRTLTPGERHQYLRTGN